MCSVEIPRLVVPATVLLCHIHLEQCFQNFFQSRHTIQEAYSQRHSAADKQKKLIFDPDNQKKTAVIVISPFSKADKQGRQLIYFS